MSTVCEACGTSNRATAMFCIGCAQRLPAFVSSGPSALETMEAARAPASAVRSDRAEPVRSPGVPRRERSAARWLPLGLLALALPTGVALWRLYGQFPDTARSSEPALVALTPAPVAAPGDAVEVEAPPPPARGPEPTVAALGSADFSANAPGVPATSSGPREWFERAETITEPGSTAPSRPVAGGGTAVQAATTFYRALSAGDGATAAALITPSKRGSGPFAAERMSSFYGSFRQPLAVQSIRPLESDAVEVRYTYRASRSVCAGVAVVRTEQVMQQTMIRSITANC